ncbi:MAG: spore maturation protein [Methylacidiphilales bacterium]|nr:spore maturation protein [Candidatus Methylacidiphilales bacterium]
MLNYIWLGLIGLAVVMGGFRGNIGEVGQAAIDGANLALKIAGVLVAITTLWLGLMRLAEKAGLVNRLGLALKPIMVWLFPEVPPDHPAMGAIIMNVAANMLGLNNAATPLGLRAMNELEKLNRRPGVASNAMCMLLAINTSSITLIPVTVIGLLVLYHGKNPTAIIGTSLAATVIAHAFAIGTCKLLERTRWSRRQLEGAAAPLPRETGAASAKAVAEGRNVEETAERADVSLPWAPGSRWILAGAAGLFLGFLLGTAFPELTRFLALRFDGLVPFFTNPAATSQTVAPEVASRFFLWRLVDALSLLAIPCLIFFFPLYAALRRIPVYEEFVEGGKEGFQIILRIFPYIVGMLAAVGMLNAAGGLDLITWILSPVTNLIHFPAQLVPLALIRPFSGTASLALLAELVKNNGPDSLIALTAGTLYGCSETTFYVIAVYFGSVGIRKTRHAIPAGLVADVVGPVASVLICRAVLG